MSEKNKGNTKSYQSKQLLENALLSLMQTENYQDITIQEIVDHAGVSRRTFYRNYSTKIEIIESYFNKLWHEYISIIVQQVDLSLPNIARVLFTQVNKNIEFWFLINRHHLIPVLLDQVDLLLPPVFEEVKGKSMNYSKESIRYALAFSSGGFIRILIQWLDDNEQKSPEAMAAIVKDFFSICSI